MNYRTDVITYAVILAIALGIITTCFFHFREQGIILRTVYHPKFDNL